MKKTLGVIVGRFQIDELHDGHLNLLKHVYTKNDDVLILVGSRPSPNNATNPLPYDEIKDMLSKYIVFKGEVGQIIDDSSDEVWSRNLDSIISDYCDRNEITNVILYSGRDGFANVYSGIYLVEAVDFNCPSRSTDIRTRIGELPGYSRTWRRGYIAAYQNLQHRTYHTVDMACMKRLTNGKFQVLLAQKPNSNEWRFPGGFVEAGEKFIQAAGREFFEETDLYTLDGFKIVDDFIIDDWRVRHQKGVDHKTVLCIGWYLHGQPVPKDDIAALKWFDVESLFWNSKGLMVAEHRKEMVNSLIKYLTNNCGMQPFTKPTDE